MKEQIAEMREIGILSIVLSTKGNVPLLVEEAKYKLVFGAAEARKIPKNVEEQRFSATYLCYT